MNSHRQFLTNTLLCSVLALVGASTVFAQCAVCDIDLLTGALVGECVGGDYIDYENPEFQPSGFYYATGRITPDPVGGACRSVRIEVLYSGEPEGWTVDICDSHSCNGYGGDGGDTNWAAELEVLHDNFRVYSAQTDEVSVERIVDAQALSLADSKAEFVIEDQRATLTVGQVSLVALTPNNEFLFDFNDRSTQYGPPNHDIYASFNGVLTGQADRNGKGARRVRISVE